MSSDGKFTQEEIEAYRKKGKIPENWWEMSIAARSKTEYTGFPTQKPLALLRRIIKASSNEGDWVLDPFCGCATTCLAAQELGRRWIGIDVAPKSFDLVKMRFANELPLLTLNAKQRKDRPFQSGFKVPPKNELKDILYGKQHGNCNGCKVHLIAPRHFHIDHIVPKSKGGQEHAENKQLLCGSCNSIKGGRAMAFLTRRLVELALIPA